MSKDKKVEILDKTKATLVIETSMAEDGETATSNINLELDPPAEDGQYHPAGEIAVGMIKSFYGDDVRADDAGGPAVNEDKPA